MDRTRFPNLGTKIAQCPGFEKIGRESANRRADRRLMVPRSSRKCPRHRCFLLLTIRRGEGWSEGNWRRGGIWRPTFSIRYGPGGRHIFSGAVARPIRSIIERRPKPGTVSTSIREHLAEHVIGFHRLCANVHPLLSGNSPGIQRDARAAGKARRNGSRVPAETMTPCSIKDCTMRRPCRSLVPRRWPTSPRGSSPR